MQIQKLESQIAAEEAERAAPGKARAEEEYYLATLVAGAERKEIARLQKEVSLAVPSCWLLVPRQLLFP